MLKLRTFISFVALVFLSACQHHRMDTVHSDAGWLQDPEFFISSYRRYNAQKQKKLTAKVAVKTVQLEEKTRELREQANMVWQVTEGQQIMRLYGPLGAGATKLTFDANGANLKDSKGRLYHASSINELLLDVVGWPIPVEALSYWVFALPEPGKVYRYQLDEEGRVAKLNQAGWQIEYSQYQMYSGNMMPRKIVALKTLSPQQTVSVRLVAKSWQWGSE